MLETILRDARVDVIVTPQLQGNTLQRTSLFLDEVVDVQLLLHTAVNEDTVRTQLSNLSIVLEAHAAASVDRGVTDRVFTCKLEALNGITKAISSDSASVKWSTEMHIDRTRITSPSPTLTLTATLSLAESATSVETKFEADDEYLTPGVPTSSANLLISLAQSPAFAKYPSPPTLPASRLLRTAPARPRSIKPPQVPASLRGSSVAFPLLPAVTSKIRTFGIGSVTKVLANLDIEVSKHIQKATVSDVVVELEHGVALPQGLPLQDNSSRQLKGGDIISLIYDLQPSKRHSKGNALVDHNHPSPGPDKVKMSLTAIVTTLDDVPQTIRITSKWQTPVDLVSLLQPSTHISTSAATSNSRLAHPITLTTSRHPAMPHPAPQGSTIRWQLLVANRSMTETLNLAIVPVMQGASPTAPRDFSSNSDHIVASACNIASKLPAWLYASTETHNKAESLIKSASTSASAGSYSPHPSLLILTPLIQLGPLPPGTSTTAEAVFLVLDGHHQSIGLEALRIIDLESRPKDGKGRWSWTDVKSDLLPDIVTAEPSVLPGGLVGSVQNTSLRDDEVGKKQSIEVA